MGQGRHLVVNLSVMNWAFISLGNLLLLTYGLYDVKKITFKIHTVTDYRINWEI